MTGKDGGKGVRIGGRRGGGKRVKGEVMEVGGDGAWGN